VDDLEDVQYVEEEKGFFGKILQSPVLLTVGAIFGWCHFPQHGRWKI